MDNRTDTEVTKIKAKKPWYINLARYSAKVIFPIFLGSFLFGGALLSYSSNDAMNKTIMEDGLRPTKATYRRCHESLNKLFVDESYLSGNFRVMASEVQYKWKDGDKSIPLEYGAYLQGLSTNMRSLVESANQERTDSLACYEELYSDLQDLGVMLGLSQDYTRIANARAADFNKLEARRHPGDKSDDDFVNFASAVMHAGIEKTVDSDPQKLADLMNMGAAEQQNEADVDKAIFDMEQKYYVELMDIYVAAIQKRFNRGIWHYIAG